MIEYRFATVSDIDALVQSRLEMLRVVNNLGDDYVFGENFVQASREYFPPQCSVCGRRTSH